MNNQYGNTPEAWERFLTHLEKDDDIKALAITEYFLLTSYERVIEFRRLGRLKNIELIFPNLEFRLTPENQEARAIQLHLLINSNAESQIETVKQELSTLQFIGADRSYYCTPAEMRTLGAKRQSSKNNGESQDSYDYRCERAGVEQFKPSYDRFFEWYKNTSWIRSNSIIGVARGDDGVMYKSGTGWDEFSESLLRRVEFVFSGQPADRMYWLGQKPGTEKDIPKLGLPKPCLHGCDAHDWEKLLRPDQERRCWIKADVSFNGLRQVLLEPSDRLHIGPTFPPVGDPGKVVSSLIIRDPNGNFPAAELPLSPYLTVIIGQRGSGKSAVTDLLAFAARAFAPDVEAGYSSKSFIGRAKELISDCEVGIRWMDGRLDSGLLGTPPTGSPLIRYLPQQFVERLCSVDLQGSDLSAQVEHVIFQHVPREERLGTNSFDELYIRKTETVNLQIKSDTEEIEMRIKEICALVDEMSQLSLVNSQIREQTDELDRLRAHRRSIGDGLSEDDSARLDHLSRIRGVIALAEEEKSAIDLRLHRLRLLQAKLQLIENEIRSFNVEISSLIEGLPIDADARQVLQVSFGGDWNSVVASCEATLLAQLDKHETKEFSFVEDGAARLLTLAKAREEVVAIQVSLETSSEVKSQLALLDANIEATEAAVTSLSERKERLDSIESIDMPAVESRIAELIASRLEKELEKSGIRNGIADRFREKMIKSVSETEKLFGVNIDFSFDDSIYYARVEQCYNTRLRPVKRMIEDDPLNLLAISRRMRAEWLEGNLAAIARSIMEAYSLAKNLNRNKDREGFYRKGNTLESALRAIFSLSDFKFEYRIEFRETPIDRLSPGVKGIALLVLFLAADEDDTRPLVIDQPEENLDSISIVETLCQFVRHAKRRRQIVLVTHNANLVVNTDAELVLIANAIHKGPGCLPEFQYLFGSLECEDVGGRTMRDRVCQILEGGELAFRMRDMRYTLDLKRRTELAALSASGSAA